MRHQRHPQDRARDLGGLDRVLRAFHAAALAASARVDLRFYYDAPADTLRRRLSLLHIERHLAARHRDVILGQDGLGLILMNFHGNLLVLRNSQSFQYNMRLLPHLERLAGGASLSAGEAQSAMQTILDGKASPAQIAGFLMALRVHGETVDELVGFARAMRQTAVRVDLGLPGETLLDTCGTGGDGAGTFNISTVAAFVVAGAGVRVAKHGNRAVTSKSGCGSADLLDSFGIAIDASPERAAQAIREVGIGFFFAPAIHTAMKHAAPVRADLKIRTAFNLLGPLTNPAGANAQLVGAPSE